MHITCPNCEIKFTIPSEKISNIGRYVRCSKCGYLWHAKNPEVTTEQETIKPINDYIKQEGVNLPVIVANNNFKYTRFFIVIITILIVLILSYLVWDLVDKTIVDNELQVNDVKVVSHKGDNLTVQYKIRCKECSSFQLPLVRFELYDKNFALLENYLSEDLFQESINNNYAIVITDLMNIPKNTEYLNVTLETYSNLFFRNK